jgi:tryptophanyl-tRNA synthetase
MKKQLGADMAAFIKPIRERTESILADNNFLDKIMKHGKEKARANAAETISLVRKAIGINYY